VAAGRRHFERALGALLPLMSRKSGCGPPAARKAGSGREQHLRALEMVGELDQRAGRENVEIGRAQAASGPQGAGQMRPFPAALAAAVIAAPPRSFLSAEG
jgi:hypothetical protein